MDSVGGGQSIWRIVLESSQGKVASVFSWTETMHEKTARRIS